jgi:hypothetical protein
MDEKKDGKDIKFDGKNIEMIPALDARPPLEDVVRIVEVIPPKDKQEAAKVMQFLQGIEAAWHIRAKDDPALEIIEEKENLAVVRTKPNGSKELRYVRTKGPRATLYVDATELANLITLGLVQDVPVVGVEVRKEGQDAGK